MKYYECDDGVLYCEDCLETMKGMVDGSVDLAVTSPPYDNLRTYNNEIDKSWGEHIWKPIIKELFRVIKDGAWLFGWLVIRLKMVRSPALHSSRLYLQWNAGLIFSIQ